MLRFLIDWKIGHGHILRNDDCSNPHLHIHRRQFLKHIARIKHYLTSNTHLHAIIRPHSIRTICKGHKSALMSNPSNAIWWIIISEDVFFGKNQSFRAVLNSNFLFAFINDLPLDEGSNGRRLMYTGYLGSNPRAQTFGDKNDVIHFAVVLRALQK